MNGMREKALLNASKEKKPRLGVGSAYVGLKAKLWLCKTS
jgi:hypothetical protein